LRATWLKLVAGVVIDDWKMDQVLVAFRHTLGEVIIIYPFYYVGQFTGQVSLWHDYINVIKNGEYRYPKKKNLSSPILGEWMRWRKRIKVEENGLVRNVIHVLY
jgi:hypothetical protein